MVDIGWVGLVGSERGIKDGGGWLVDIGWVALGGCERRIKDRVGWLVDIVLVVGWV